MKRIGLILLLATAVFADTPKLSDKSLLTLKDQQIQMEQVKNRMLSIQIEYTQLATTLEGLQGKHQISLKEAITESKIDTEKFNVDPLTFAVTLKPAVGGK